MDREQRKSFDLRVLMQNRPTAFSHRGGDTEVMEKTAECLRGMGVKVDIDVRGEKDPGNYDLLHIYNFATPEITKSYAEVAVKRGIPFVVTTMYEDRPLFFNQMSAEFDALVEYINGGQQPSAWRSLEEKARQAPPSGPWENQYAAENADLLIASGEREREALLSDYPKAKRVETYPLGCEVVDSSDGGEMFRKAYGLRDFVLCVGRLETRKNQLMLLKALEESDLTLVLASGGFTYQSDYEQACRVFKRSGRTEFLGRLEPEMLASAYEAARVHALPSWYELPGIVSMEAARRGASLVVSDRGTARDYFCEDAYYCDPGSADSIRNAVLAAYYSPSRKSLSHKMVRYTWKKASERVLSLYEEVILAKRQNKPSSISCSLNGKLHCPQNDLGYNNCAPTIKAGIASLEEKKSKKQFRELVEEASLFLKDAQISQEDRHMIVLLRAEARCWLGQNQEALEDFKTAAQFPPLASRALSGQGAMLASRKDFDQADRLFAEALTKNRRNDRAIAGRGLCASVRGDTEGAWDYYSLALCENPENTVSILGIVELGYSLGRLTQVESALRNYLELHPADLSMLYSLAGCLYSQGREREALEPLGRIKLFEPNNEMANELLERIENNRRLAVG